MIGRKKSIDNIHVTKDSFFFAGTFSVQSANISYLTSSSSMIVTCLFAINAPASACMAVFESSSFGLSFNGIVSHSPGSLASSGVVGIPQRVFQQGVKQGLTSAVFDVKVFDVNVNGKIDDWPAFEQREALEVEVGDVKLSAGMSPTRTVGEKTCNCLTNSSTTLVLVYMNSLTTLVHVYIILLNRTCVFINNSITFIVFSARL